MFPNLRFLSYSASPNRLQLAHAEDSRSACRRLQSSNAWMCLERISADVVTIYAMGLQHSVRLLDLGDVHRSEVLLLHTVLSDTCATHLSLRLEASCWTRQDLRNLFNCITNLTHVVLTLDMVYHKDKFDSFDDLLSTVMASLTTTPLTFLNIRHQMRINHKVPRNHEICAVVDGVGLHTLGQGFAEAIPTLHFIVIEFLCLKESIQKFFLMERNGENKTLVTKMDEAEGKQMLRNEWP
ncbi:hypothetical protein OBBRIDRAFT_527137 [Obba rivulosa]|uniref:Uncharacterized protein n=1 Tax=Obba rivulosa TaxID=1052685 RepID=A0A8E2B4D5_9APHY|nr:hypothetical protein OBBRIDRAFT_527137 [Obba rivulosa]